jgi:hypothetical protein
MSLFYETQYRSKLNVLEIRNFKCHGLITVARALLCS